MKVSVSRRVTAFAIFTLAQGTPVSACECPKESLSERSRTASSIFLADIYAAGREVHQGHVVLHVKVDSAVAIKGSVPSYIFTPFGSASCGASVEVPSKAWFFVDSQGMFESCGGHVLGLSGEGAALWRKNRKQIVEAKRDFARVPFEEFTIPLMCGSEVKLIDVSGGAAK